MASFTLQLVVASVDNKLLKGSTKTNNVSAITTTSFLQLPKDNSAFIQISVPNDFPAITTSSFTQLYVPTMITSIPYPANITASLATSKSLFLLCDEDNLEIMTPILLLNYIKDVPAIMVATHANYMLQLIVMPIQRGLIKLIVNFISTSEGARAPLSKLIVGCSYSEISFHFCEDCRKFCEGVKDSTIGISSNNGLVGFIGLSLLSLIELIGQISLVGLSGFSIVGLRDINGLLIGQISFVGLVGISGFSLISLTGHSDINNLKGFIGLNGLVGIRGFGLISLVGLGGFGLVGVIGLSLISHYGLIGFIGLGISFIGHGISLVGLSGFGLISLVGLSLAALINHISLPGLIRDIGFGLISLVGLRGFSLVSLSGINGLIDFISLANLVSFSLNGSIGKGIIVNSLQFEIEMKQAHHDLFWRENWLWCVWRVFSSLAGLNSVFLNALQNAKQVFLDRIPQMTKYCIMKECENILHGFLYVFDLAFVILKGIYGFKFPKRFWRSLPEISLFYFFFCSSANVKT
jgi:hypothetical protein